MEAREQANKLFREAYDQIPEIYRERYGILLIEAYENISFIPMLSLQIKHARLSIIPNGKEISVEEFPEKLIIKVDGVSEIFLNRHNTLMSVII